MTDHIFKCALLIENNPSHAKIVTDALHDFCEETIYRSSAEEGLASVGSVHPDLIVVDLNLSEQEGPGVISKLVAAWPLIPIIVLTASLKFQEAIAAMKLGVRDVIVKAFDGPFHEVLILSLSRVRAALQAEAERLKLQMDMEALRVAVENSKDGLAVTDSEGMVVYGSPSFESFVHSCGGKNSKLWEIFSSRVQDSEKLRKIVQEKYQTLPVGAMWHTEVRFVDDKNLAYDLSLSAIRAGTKSSESQAEVPNECVVWIRDISEITRRERFQREILSTTSHDLKNPLSAILLSAGMASDMVKDDAKVAQLMMRIGASAQTAVNLIDDFMSARRIKDGSFILHPTDHNVSKILTEVVQSFETVALARGIELKFECADQNLEWCFDRSGFERVISNIISNALKFTPRGGKVKVTGRADGDSLHVSISDTGAGLAPYEVSKIFERSARLERHADIPGTGLGLFIVKSIVSAHGGKVEVTSHVGKGTTFELIFPEAPPKNEHGELVSLDFL